MFALHHSATIETLCGNCQTAVEDSIELSALAKKKGASFWVAMGILDRGRLHDIAGQTTDALLLINSGIAALQSSGATLWLPINISWLAGLHAKLGQFEEAWRRIDEAMALVQSHKEKWCEAEILCVAGDILLSRSEAGADGARDYFERAIAIARSQAAKSLELRAATRLATFWRDRSEHLTARAVLAPVYGWFTEGFDTHDLRRAKALLDELA
jgi:hypothetical protein